MKYNEYLFSCLLKIYDKEFAELEYDLQFEEVPLRYREFTKSQFNLAFTGEYECIINYLKDKYGQPCVVECDIAFLRNLFIAGSTLQEDYTDCNGDTEEMEAPDFGEYMMLTKGIDVDKK